MLNQSARNLCIHQIADGLRKGLSQFSGPSRAALIYAENPDDPIRIYDPQDLLHGHEPKLKEIYLDSNEWRTQAPNTRDMKLFGQMFPEKNLQLAGLISYGGRTRSIFYQMWFTEHHPDMCSIGPTERWLEDAVCLLSHDFGSEDAFYTGTSRYVLSEYATHAVRDYIMDELNLILGWDTYIRVYPILEAVLDISKTLEEGAWPKGQLMVVEAAALSLAHFLVRFPSTEQPSLKAHKHVRKLLLAVEDSDRRLVVVGKSIVGIASNAILPECRVTADFRGGHGFLRLAGKPVCSFFDGRFHSKTRKPNLVQLEEVLLELEYDSAWSHVLFKIVSAIVGKAASEKHGCTLVIDLHPAPIAISGQRLDDPVDLREEPYLELAKSLAKVDGALHIGADMHLHAFACLLDGRAVPGENRARGARYNSALRFTSEHQRLIVVVVSSDRPVSVIQSGVELSAQCEWKSFADDFTTPPTLERWLGE